MNKLASNFVGSIGPPDAKICFVGEAPGKEEDMSLEPFVGAAGQFFKRVCAKRKIVWTDCLVWNVFQQRPPKNEIGYFYEDKRCTRLTLEGRMHVDALRVWLELLLKNREEEGSGPNVLVALGRTALFHLTGQDRIYKWRGSILPCTLVPGFKVYVTLHPSGVMRSLEEEKVKLVGQKKEFALNALPLFEIDMDRILVQSETPTYEAPQRKYDTNLSFVELKLRLEGLLAARPPYVACDIETLQGATGPVVWCIGFASDPAYAFVVPIIRMGSFAWTLEEEAILWRLISEIFLAKDIKKVFQGGMYDLAILGRYYGLRLAEGTYDDTMYCHHASYPYLWKKLEVLCSIYTWEPYYKDEGRVSLGARTDESEFRYNGKDCCVTREIMPIVLQNANELSTARGYRRTMGILPSHLGMTLRGVRIDTVAKERLTHDFITKSAEMENNVKKETGININLSSPAQKAKLLYGYLGLELQIDRKTGKATTDKNALKKLARKYKGKLEGNIVNWILDYQKFSKLASTYAEMKLDSDGRIRTSYSLVSTWRMNSSSSPFGGWTKGEREGGNLQNIPVRSDEGKMIRRLFIPDEGMVFLAADRRQAEAMVVAWLSQDPERIQMFEKDWDVHWHNAKLIFDLPMETPYLKEAVWIDPVTKEEYVFKELRDIGKTIVHAGNYGMGPYKLQEVLALQGFIIEFRYCKLFLERHKARNHYLLAWQRDVRDEVRATRTLISPPPISRKREFMGRFDTNLYNAAYAFVPQNTVGEINEVTCQRVWQRIPEFQLLLNIHDEVFGQCAERDVPKVMRQMEELAHIPLDIKGRTLDIPIDFKWSPISWGDMTEIKNGAL